MHQKDDQQFAKVLNRLCIGKQTNDDLRILQSRQVTQEQFETLHHIPHFFPTRRKVESYNGSVLQSSPQYTLTITAIHIPPSDISESAKEILQAAINKRTVKKTGGLPRQVKIAVNHQYDLISNIAVHDGLMNGAKCCIKYIQRQDINSNFGYSLKMIVLDQNRTGIIVIYRREGILVLAGCQYLPKKEHSL